MATIRRSNPRVSFLIVGNVVCRDARLSHRARGLLVWILSLPPNWRVNSDDLAADRRDAADAREGRDAVRAALNELRANGYASLNRVRDRKSGTISTVWTIGDAPDDLDRRDGEEIVEDDPDTERPTPRPENPSPVYSAKTPRPEKPTPVKPTPVSQAVLKDSVRENREKRTTSTTRPQTAPPTDSVVVVAALPDGSPEQPQTATAATDGTEDADSPAVDRGRLLDALKACGIVGDAQRRIAAQPERTPADVYHASATARKRAKTNPEGLAIVILDNREWHAPPPPSPRTTRPTQIGVTVDIFAPKTAPPPKKTREEMRQYLAAAAASFEGGAGASSSE